MGLHADRLCCYFSRVTNSLHHPVDLIGDYPFLHTDYIRRYNMASGTLNYTQQHSPVYGRRVVYPQPKECERIAIHRRILYHPLFVNYRDIFRSMVIAGS